MRGKTWTALACAGALWAWSGCDSTEAQDGGEGGTTSTSGGGTTGATTGVATSGGATTGASSGTGGTTSGGGTTGGTGGQVSCPVALPSQCQTPGTAHPGSVVRGVAQLAAGFNPPAGTRGDLVMYLTHRYEGAGSIGGVFHAVDRVANVDLSNGPVPFQIDMCHNDIAMYSEDDCAFNLIVILDTNGNNFDPDPNNPQNQTPDVGEATSTQLVSISCQGSSQCLSATLGCASGQSCTAFVDPPPQACVCAPATCNSDYKFCN